MEIVILVFTILTFMVNTQQTIDEHKTYTDSHKDFLQRQIPISNQTVRGANENI